MKYRVAGGPKHGVCSHTEDKQREPSGKECRRVNQLHETDQHDRCTAEIDGLADRCLAEAALSTACPLELRWPCEISCLLGSTLGCRVQGAYALDRVRSRSKFRRLVRS